MNAIKTETQEKKCIICGNPFLVAKGKKYHRMSICVRQRHSLTCSKKCSRVYLRVVSHICHDYYKKRCSSNGK